MSLSLSHGFHEETSSSDDIEICAPATSTAASGTIKLKNFKSGLDGLSAQTVILTCSNEPLLDRSQKDSWGDLSSVQLSDVFEISVTLNSHPPQTIREVLSVENSDLENKWDDYLKQLPKLEDPKVPEVVINGMKTIRKQLNAFLGRTLTPPQAGPVEDGMQMIWDDKVRQLVVDVTHNNTYYWMFKDRELGIVRDGQGVISSKFPPKELGQLIQLWQSPRCFILYGSQE